MFSHTTNSLSVGSTECNALGATEDRLSSRLSNALFPFYNSLSLIQLCDTLASLSEIFDKPNFEGGRNDGV